MSSLTITLADLDGPCSRVSENDTYVHGPQTRPVNTGIVCTGHNDKSCCEQKYCGIFFLDTNSQLVRYNFTEYKRDVDYCTVHVVRYECVSVDEFVDILSLGNPPKN